MKNPNFNGNDAFSRAQNSIEPASNIKNNDMDELFNPATNTFEYSSELKNAAESFLIKSFETGAITSIGMSNVGDHSIEHAPLLFNIAMHVITDANWIQMQPSNVTMNIIESDIEDEPDNENDSDR